MSYTCNRCGKPVKDHDYTVHIAVLKAPTALEDGQEIKTCVIAELNLSS
ncbi:MAG: hypothetical protein WA323_05595 [Candidatus Nitrosopolaris sp.]